MRRYKQALSLLECADILNKATSGTLAVMGDDNYPYAVPLSFVYDHNRLIFHSATSGHKIDAIEKNPKVSFCVIAQDQVVEEKYTTYFIRTKLYICCCSGRYVIYTIFSDRSYKSVGDYIYR